MWADFPLPAPRSVAPRGHVAHALAGCTLRPPAAASGPVVVSAFALKADVQSTFIYRLRRVAALSVRLEYRPSLSFVHRTYSGFGVSHTALSPKSRGSDSLLEIKAF